MTEIETWHPSQSPLAIEYTRSVVDEVRDQAVAGYRRLSRGGVEVGGVLYGTREEDKVRIVATQPISCEYKFGPSLILSAKDKLRLFDQLADSQNHAEFKNLTVVGCYVSHPRTSIALTEGDLEIFNEFFPAIWNFVLVLKPAERAVRCGFFVREARGSLNIAQSYQEFDLGLPRSTDGSQAVRQIADQVASSLGAQREPSPDPAALRRRAGGRRDVMEMPMPMSPPAYVTTQRSRPVPAGFGGMAAAPAPDPAAQPPNWSTAVARPRSAIVTRRRTEQPRRLQWRWLVLWVFALVTLVGAVYAYREFTAPAPLGLRVQENDGDLLIQWDSTARPLRWALAGRLEIQGAEPDKIQVDLSDKELALGKYLFSGTEGDTSIHLNVSGKFGYHADESTRYVAQVAPMEPSASKPVVDIRDRRKLQLEVRRLRDDLDKSQQRVKELESLLYNRR